MKRKKQISKVRKTIKIILRVALLCLIIFLIPKCLKIYNLSVEAKQLVNDSSVSTFKDTKTTLVYDINEELLCSLKSEKDLYYVQFDAIPENMVNAFLIMEDKKFYKHNGVDYFGMIRAAVQNKMNNGIVQGASTITQQLARNIFLTYEVTWERKIEEIFISIQMEKKYSKKQILEFYLNNIYFGNGYYGVEAASEGYFSKNVSELSLEEQCFLAAIPNNPTLYDPLKKFENTNSRKNRIMEQLVDNGYIKDYEYYMAKENEIVLNPKESTEVNNSVATYVKHCATESFMKLNGFDFKSTFSSDQDYENYQQLYDESYARYQERLISGGYTVYTSIDRNIQDKLQSKIDNQLAANQEKDENGVYKFQGSATCIDNSTGNVVAIVGSRSQDDIRGNVLNRAYQSYRQPGSSIKPLSVYTPYIQTGATPESKVEDTPVSNGPANSDGTYAGEITLTEAVKWSKNTVAWKVYQQISPQTGLSFLTKMDFKKVWMDKDTVAASIGGFTYGVSSEEMAGGYATLANDGVYREPTCIIKILNSMGKQIISEEKRDKKIYTKAAARQMTQMLVSVVNDSDGTGRYAAPNNALVAGKTGTTNEDKDIWMCGYSTYYTTTVWAGYDYPKSVSWAHGIVYDVFKEFMEEIHEGLPRTEFNISTDKNPKTTKDLQTTEAVKETTQVDNTETLQENTTSGDADKDATKSSDGNTATNAGNNATDKDAVTGTTSAGNKTEQTKPQATTKATTKPTQESTTKSSKKESGDVDVDIRKYTDADAGNVRSEW